MNMHAPPRRAPPRRCTLSATARRRRRVLSAGARSTRQRRLNALFQMGRWWWVSIDPAGRCISDVWK